MKFKYTLNVYSTNIEIKEKLYNKAVEIGWKKAYKFNIDEYN